MVGISTANPSQLTAIRDTVSGNKSPTDSSTNPQAAKSDEKKAQEPELSPEDRRRIAELKRTDAEVRTHEQAHINAGRGLITSGPNYEYTYGPDGKQYAVSGEVGIDTSAEREAQANINKGQRIQDAALAPADPSAQDYQVAATGRQLEDRGYRDLRTEQLAEQQAQAEEQRDQRLQAYQDSTNPPAQVDVFA